jgi:hypothetical protein
MLSPIHLDEARTRDTHDDDVYLIVDVLPDAVSKRTWLALSSLLASRVQTAPTRP